MDLFPQVFDCEIYKQNNSDLKDMSEDDLFHHYIRDGKKEGRKCSLITHRGDLIKLIPDNLSCLEIGPFDNPVLTNCNVKYFDVLNKEDLLERSKNLNRTQNVPHIDYVDEKGNLSVIDEKFDIILSCHSIEHQLDFIKHINDVSSLLNPAGIYIVICPDKRYCFDHFISESTIADIIHMNYINNEKHNIKSVIEHRALTCHNNTILHWDGDHGEQSIFNIQYAIDEYNTGKFIDVHSLQFTPDSFENVIGLLNKNNFIDMQCDKVYPTVRNSNEFYVILKNKMK